MMLYLPGEEGQGLVEYGLVLVLIAIVIVVVLSMVGTAISNLFSQVSSALQGTL